MYDLDVEIHLKAFDHLDNLSRIAAETVGLIHEQIIYRALVFPDERLQLLIVGTFKRSALLPRSIKMSTSSTLLFFIR